MDSINNKKRIANDMIELLGNTPMVKINSVCPNKNVNIYAKLEGFNPTGSIKDRVAYRMIEQAIKDGKFNKDMTIIEATSGNTGIGLAMVAAVRGYKVEIVMSEAVSIERRKMIRAYGAKITLTDGSKGTDGAIVKVRELVKSNPDKYFHPDQFSNEYNKMAHYENTAREIWEQTNGDIDYFVSSLGTSGTLMGVSSFLKNYNKNIKIVSAEPVKGHYIQGLKNMEEAIVPAIYDKDKLDEIIMIESEDAFKITRQIAKDEGIFVGMSSGAALWAALEIAKKIDKGNIVVIFPDRGERYLSTDLFSID